MSQVPDVVRAWVNACATLLSPAQVHWMDGSDSERAALEARAVREGVLLPLNPVTHPRCFLHRSRPDDTARTEHLTFVRSRREDDAGPTNHWWAPDAAKARLTDLFRDSMRGRTLYVVPFVLGPEDSPFRKVGVQLTDSVYVALNLRIMTRVGEVPGGRSRPMVTSPAACTASAIRIPRAASSATSRRRTPPGASGPATVATRSCRRSRSRCGSRASAPVTKAGSPSTCSSWPCSPLAATFATSRRRSQASAGRPTSPW